MDVINCRITNLVGAVTKVRTDYMKYHAYKPKV